MPKYILLRFWIALAIFSSAARLFAVCPPPQPGSYFPMTNADLVASVVAANGDGIDSIVDLCQYTGGPLTTADNPLNALPIIISNGTFTLQNGTLVRAGAAFRFMEIALGARVTILNVIMRGGNAGNQAQGGAILNFGTIDLIDNSLFESNSARDGGAIAVLGGSIVAPGGVIQVIVNSQFLSNTSTGNAAQLTSGYGGAIYAQRSDEDIGGLIGVIENTLFQFNRCTGTIADGGCEGGAIALDPGTINNITNSRFSQNSAVRRGGAIVSRLAPGMGTISGSLFANNDASLGGAIALSFSELIRIRTSTFTANLANSGGGALYVRASLIETIEDSTFDLNGCAGVLGGGAILLQTDGDPSRIDLLVNSTFNVNIASHAQGFGGGAIAFNEVTNAIAGPSRNPRNNIVPPLDSSVKKQQVPPSIISKLSNSTIAQNRSFTNGGGIALSLAGNIPLVESTIIALNIVPEAGGQGPDVFEPQNVKGVTEEKFNLVSNNSGATTSFVAGLPSAPPNNSYVGTQANPILAAQVNLGPLANNGGPTRTRALLPGSLAIDHGSNPENRPFDQRGTGFARTSGAQTDIGAFEVQQSSTPSNPVIEKLFNPSSISVGQTSTLRLTLRNLNAVPATSLNASDTLPAGLVVASGVLVNTCTGSTLTAIAGTNLITLTAPSIAASSSCFVEIPVAASFAGTYVNNLPAGALTFMVGGATLGSSATSATLTVGDVRPTVSKSFSPNNVDDCGCSRLVITLTNPSSIPATLTAPFVDRFPRDLKVVGFAQTTCLAGSTTASDSSITLGSGASIPANSFCTISVNVESRCNGEFTNRIAAGALVTSNGSNLLGAEATVNFRCEDSHAVEARQLCLTENAIDEEENMSLYIE